MTTDTQTSPDDTTAEPKRRFKFPTAFTVLFFVLVLVWILTFIIPPGTYSYQSASGWMNLFTPTSAIVMGGLALSKVRYDRYLRFIAPLLGILLILTCLFMLLE